MMHLLVLAAVAVAGVSAGGVCHLANVPVMKNLDEHKVAGVWFEKKFFYSTRYSSPPHYEDFAIVIHPDGHGYGYGYDYNKGLFVTERVRKDGHCENQNDGFRKRVDHPAKFKFDKKEIGKKDLDWWIVETDYHNYLIEFSCLKEYPHGICALPEVVVYYRNKKDDSAQKALHRAQELLPHLCVDPHISFETSQKEPGCVDKKYHDYGYPGYPHPDSYGYGYGYDGYYPYDYGYGYGYDRKYDGKYDGKYDDKYYGKYDGKYDGKYGNYGYPYGYGYGKYDGKYGNYGYPYGGYGYRNYGFQYGGSYGPAYGYGYPYGGLPYGRPYGRYYW